MIIVCAWCRRYQGETIPYEEPGITHGICSTCSARQSWKRKVTLVVSRSQANTLPVLEGLLQGIPEIQLLTDRRLGDRRGPEYDGGILTERRSGRERRRETPAILV